MDADFWLSRWRDERIGFHAPEVNPLLVQHLDALSLHRGQCVFVPLCGKTLDIGWLLGEGFRVCAVELSLIAVESLFKSLGVTPTTHQIGKLTVFQAADLCVYAGDFFDLDTATLGRVDAVYDRAALVALPDALRIRYARHMTTLTHSAQQLVVTFEYDQSQMQGPPFSVDAETVHTLYAAQFNLTRLVDAVLDGGFRGGVPARESVWHLSPR